MSGQQGTINKLESGDVGGALHDIATWVSNRVHGLESQFPALGTFVSQFSSDFGKQVLADAEALAPTVIAGTTTIQAAAEQLVTQAAGQAASIASTDATTIALNALRVQITGLQAPNVPSSASAPAAPGS